MDREITRVRVGVEEVLYFELRKQPARDAQKAGFLGCGSAAWLCVVGLIVNGCFEKVSMIEVKKMCKLLRGLLEYGGNFPNIRKQMGTIHQEDPQKREYVS